MEYSIQSPPFNVNEFLRGLLPGDPNPDQETSCLSKFSCTTAFHPAVVELAAVYHATEVALGKNAGLPC